MKYILHFIALLFISSHSFCQNIQRQENETAEVFINKVIPDSAVLAHQIISTNIWTKKSKSFIAFYEDKRKKTNSRLHIVFYVIIFGGSLYLFIDTMSMFLHTDRSVSNSSFGTEAISFLGNAFLSFSEYVIIAAFLTLQFFYFIISAYYSICDA
jgi:hypothetical protein